MFEFQMLMIFTSTYRKTRPCTTYKSCIRLLFKEQLNQSLLRALVTHFSLALFIRLYNALSPAHHLSSRRVCLLQRWLSLCSDCSLPVGHLLEETKVLEGLFYSVITGSQAFNPQRSDNDIPSAFITLRSAEKRWLWTNEHSDLYAINMTRAV